MLSRRGFGSLVVLGIGIALAMAPAAGVPMGAQGAQNQGPLASAAYVPNEVLVKFRAEVAAADRAAARDDVNGVQKLSFSGSGTGLELMTTTLTVPDAIRLLQARPEVVYAEPNWIVRHTATSNDPHYTSGSTWGLYGSGTSPSNAFGSGAGQLWTRGFTGSDTVYVAVIDQGIDFNHPDLAANIWTNPFEVLDGYDNDGNGYVDDVHGWCFVHAHNSIYDGGSTPAERDVDGHGTHVAGILGARGGNGIGVAGVNWNITIISTKFLGPNGGTMVGAIAAIDYVTDLKVRHGLNIVATNNSWEQIGGGYSTALHEAIIRAAKHDILFISSAGNSASDNDAVPHYPSSYATNVGAGTESAAAYDAVIAVANITSLGALYSGSNYGAATVDLGAPGTSILSTYPQNNYEYLTGTSMAAPHVTGAAAMYKAMNPSASAEAIRSALLSEGTSTSSLVGKTVTGKRLNLAGFPVVNPPRLSISDTRLSEGNSGSKNALFSVSLSEAAATPVTVKYATADGTATSESVYTNVGTGFPCSPGPANTYPATISVPSGLGPITNLRVVLTDLTNPDPSGLDILLVGPTGKKVLLMSDLGAGAGKPAHGLTFTLDDTGPPFTLTEFGLLKSGTYRPTNFADGRGSDTFVFPAPAAPYDSTLAAFNGTNPTGTWKLFVMIDYPVGCTVPHHVDPWTLMLSTSAHDYARTSGTLTFPAGSVSQTISVPVNGDSGVESLEAFTVTLSNAGNAVIDDGHATGRIFNDDFTDNPLTSGVLVKAAHLQELRDVIDSLRGENGLAAFTWTDPVLVARNTVIKAVHIRDLRTALDQAYAAAGRALPTYTDPTLAAGTTIKAAHLDEIRSAAITLP